MNKILLASVASLALASASVFAQTAGVPSTTHPTGAVTPSGSSTGMPGAPSTPPEVVEQVPVTVTPAVPLPSEPTSAGPAVPAEPHGKLVKDARHQYKRDKMECRMSTMTQQEYRDCRKAAKMERNEKIEDVSEPRVKP